ncbi:CLUMA_CG000885, isoform A [Clunio marinus]|uniref:CLUMA_CG000885, isoform A n=1 Tax=Clunio marinus TaxID=568069 RepID=A0A1J1HHL2_9DIPT|nr:CLUMA_CG000885, isoform A [Clunio marinus]
MKFGSWDFEIHRLLLQMFRAEKRNSDGEDISVDEPPLQDESHFNCSTLCNPDESVSDKCESDTTLNRFFNNSPSIKNPDHVVTHSKTFKPGQLNSFNNKTRRFCRTEKIALNVGKPGKPKTTLAHVNDRHAGYDIGEMNTSDDCTVDNFQQALETKASRHFGFD